MSLFLVPFGPICDAGLTSAPSELLVYPQRPECDRRHRRKATGIASIFALGNYRRWEDQRIILFIMQEMRNGGGLGSVVNEAILLQVGHERSRLLREHCQHFANFPSVFPVVDEVSRQLIVLETNPQYKPTLVKSYIKKRQLKISVYALVEDGQCPTMFEPVSTPTAVFTGAKVPPNLAPLRFFSRPANDDRFILFHTCRPPTVSDDGDTAQVHIGRVEFNADGTFTLHWAAPIEVICRPVTTDHRWEAIHAYVPSDTGNTLYWDHASDPPNRMLLTAVSLKTETFGHQRHLVANLPPETRVHSIIGTAGHFLVFFKLGVGEEPLGKQDNMTAFSFRTRATHDLGQWAHRRCRTNDLFHQDLVVNRARCLADIKTLLLEMDKCVGFVCEHCAKVVKEKPKVCRVCKRMAARRYLSTDIGLLAAGFATSFCSRQCFKNNWTQHKLLHRFVKRST